MDNDVGDVVVGESGVLWALVALLPWSDAAVSDNDVSGNKTRSSPNLTCSPNRVRLSNLRMATTETKTSFIHGRDARTDRQTDREEQR